MRERQQYFIRGNFRRKIGAGNSGAVDTRAFQLGFAEIDTAQVRLAEVTAGKVQAIGVESAQIDAAKVAMGEIAALAAGFFLIEGVDPPLPEHTVEGVGFDLGCVTHRFSSLRHGVFYVWVQLPRLMAPCVTGD